MNHRDFHFSLFLLAATLFLGSGCTKKNFPAEEEPALRILHLSHTRMSDNESFNPQLDAIDYSRYDVLMLGGDMALQSSADTQVMNVLDNWFQFSRPSTLWPLGNHDDIDRALVQAYTGRPPFYTYHDRGITYLVLDTQKDFTQFKGAQLEMIESVLDTIEQSSHLFFLTHKLAWLYDEGPLQEQADDIANGQVGGCHHCTNPNNFYTDIYPRLQELTQRGIEVFCIAGDLGIKRKTYHHLTEDGIHFMATGFFYDDADNQVLLMEYYPGKRELNWEFLGVTELR